MIDKSHIEKILVLNGVSPESPEPEIKSVLIRARWHEDDVHTALLILRGESTPDEMKAELHKIASSDERVAPETLNAILGVDTVVDRVSNERVSREAAVYKKQIITLVALAFACASIFLLFVMWEVKVGLFTMR